MRFNGADYNPAYDDERLTKQIGRVYACMIDGRWRTLGEIAQITGDPEASISAQLRHLRKGENGGYIVNRRHRGERSSGLYEYQLIEPVKSKSLFDERGQGWIFGEVA